MLKEECANMKICNACQTENEDDVKYCKECGNKLTEAETNETEQNNQENNKKTVAIIIAIILIPVLFILIHDFILGVKERKARENLESLGIYTEDKEWYEYDVENILEYEERISELEKKLKEGEFDSVSDKANVALQIEMCKDSLEQEIFEFETTYNGLSKNKQKQVEQSIKLKYNIDIDTLLK